jgi:hypothetical protein
MFDNIKAFEMKLKIFKHDVKNGTFKYFPFLRKILLISKFMKNHTLKNLKNNCPTSQKQLLNSFLQDLCSSGNLKKQQNI